jgi:hypothetical protein
VLTWAAASVAGDACAGSATAHTGSNTTVATRKRRIAEDWNTLNLIDCQKKDPTTAGSNNRGGIGRRLQGSRHRSI